MPQPTAVNADQNENTWVTNQRFSSLPVKDLLKIRMKDLGVRNTDLQIALGYPMPNVIAMMKTGSMKLPANKVLIAAQMLKVDPVFLLRKVIAENDPALWDAVAAILDQHLVTKSELALLRYVRYRLDGHNVDLTKTPEFMQAVDPVLDAIKNAESALAAAAISRNDDDRR